MLQHLDSSSAPQVAHLKDVLRSRAARPRSIVIDDYENIAQAVAAGVKIKTVFVSATAAVAAERRAEAQKQLSTLWQQIFSAQANPKSEGEPTSLLRVAAGVGDDRAGASEDSGAKLSVPPIVTLEPAIIKTLFGDEKHVRLFALAAAPPPYKLNALLTAGGCLRGDTVVLDGVRITGNIGAITRTACALGAAGVIVLDSELQSVYDRRLVRASRGLVFSLPVVLASRAQFADFVTRVGCPVATLDINAQQPLAAIRDVREPLALVCGSEREGVSAQITKLAQHRYVIAMDARVESLNVSVTAALALFQHRLGLEQGV